MLVDKQSELMSDLLFTVHQHGGDDVTWKPPMVQKLENRWSCLNSFDQVMPNQQYCNCVYWIGRFLVAKCTIFHVISELISSSFVNMIRICGLTSQIFHLLKCLQNGITEANYRISSLMTCFVARVAYILLRPGTNIKYQPFSCLSCRTFF